MASHLEIEFLARIREAGLDYGLVAEHKFHEARRWRFDFAWPSLMLAVEVEGGTWVKGRHTRGSGYAGDAEKYNEAALRGWMVLRGSGDMVKDGSLLRAVRAAVEAKRSELDGSGAEQLPDWLTEEPAAVEWDDGGGLHA